MTLTPLATVMLSRAVHLLKALAVSATLPGMVTFFRDAQPMKA